MIGIILFILIYITDVLHHRVIVFALMAGLVFIAISLVQKESMEKIVKKNAHAGMALLVIIGQVLEKIAFLEKIMTKIYEFQDLKSNIILTNFYREMFLYSWI